MNFTDFQICKDQWPCLIYYCPPSLTRGSSADSISAKCILFQQTKDDYLVVQPFMFNHPAREDRANTLRVSVGLMVWAERLRCYKRETTGSDNPHIENNLNNHLEFWLRRHKASPTPTTSSPLQFQAQEWRRAQNSLQRVHSHPEYLPFYHNDSMHIATYLYM